jgi:hypothetical protein
MLACVGFFLHPTSFVIALVSLDYPKNRQNLNHCQILLRFCCVLWIEIQIQKLDIEENQNKSTPSGNANKTYKLKITQVKAKKLQTFNLLFLRNTRNA